MREESEQTFVSHAAFDDFAGDYEDALNKGVSLSGEAPEYFAEKRVEYTARWLRALGVSAPRRIADFGCGVGNSTPCFRRHFPDAKLLGLDVSAKSIEHARRIHGSFSSFLVFQDVRGVPERDIVYCNGVFHHIPPRDRGVWAERVREILTPGGYLALWENNPWNPGTRVVMSRIPFDRDAITLTSSEAENLVSEAGFDVIGTRFLFYFPRILSALRALERFGERLPFGAQYCVLARRPKGARG